MQDDNSTILYLKKYKNFHMQHIFSMHMCMWLLVQKNSWSILVSKGKINFKFTTMNFEKYVIFEKNVNFMELLSNTDIGMYYSNYKYPCFKIQEC